MRIFVSLILVILTFYSITHAEMCGTLYSAEAAQDIDCHSRSALSNLSNRWVEPAADKVEFLVDPSAELIPQSTLIGGKRLEIGLLGGSKLAIVCLPFRTTTMIDFRMDSSDTLGHDLFGIRESTKNQKCSSLIEKLITSHAGKEKIIFDNKNKRVRFE